MQYICRFIVKCRLPVSNFICCLFVGKWNPDMYPIYDILRTNTMLLEKLIQVDSFNKERLNITHNIIVILTFQNTQRLLQLDPSPLIFV